MAVRWCSYKDTGNKGCSKRMGEAVWADLHSPNTSGTCINFFTLEHNVKLLFQNLEASLSKAMEAIMKDDKQGMFA